MQGLNLSLRTKLFVLYLKICVIRFGGLRAGSSMSIMDFAALGTTKFQTSKSALRESKKNNDTLKQILKKLQFYERKIDLLENEIVMLKKF